MPHRLPILLALAAASCALAACAVTQFNPDEPGAVKRLYRNRCSQCHALPDPDAYMPCDWPGILDVYGPLAGLTQHERSYLQPWLIEQAKCGAK